VKEKRLEGATRFLIPNTCPVCGAPVVREQDTADMKCTSTNCPAQLEHHIINFVGRDAMDIKGFGEVYVHELINQGFIKNISDIYMLKGARDQLIELGIVGKEKNTDKLLEAIEHSKQNEPQRLLTGLGIPNVGKTAAKEVVKYFKSIDSVAAATVEELMAVQDIGLITAEAIYTFFHIEENVAMLNNLKDLGVNTTLEEKETGLKQKFSGLTFVITGTLPTMDRKEVGELIESYGGKVSSSISKNTDYVLAGEAAGSKLTKAQELGVAVIDEAKLKEMM
jgi:DNA ligase (NAD+)